MNFLVKFKSKKQKKAVKKYFKKLKFAKIFIKKQGNLTKKRTWYLQILKNMKKKCKNNKKIFKKKSLN